MTRDELIAALEAADGPRLGLNVDIVEFVGGEVIHGWIDGGITEDIVRFKGNKLWSFCPRYTESIDASETLRLPGFVISVTQTAKQTRQVFKVVVEDATADVWAFGEHKHEAIARTIAWLKARKQ